jgi:hypothetical protein
LTADLWNGDLIDKKIICQSYWDTFKGLCDKFRASSITINGKQAREYITPQIEKAYNEMDSQCSQYN